MLKYILRGVAIAVAVTLTVLMWGLVIVGVWGKGVEAGWNARGSHDEEEANYEWWDQYDDPDQLRDIKI